MRNINELPECPVATTISLVGSKWKLLIIRNLTKRIWRFNELQKSLNGISQKVLTDSLRQLESDGIIFRKDYHTNPPKVEYGMTDLGLELSKMLDIMASFWENVKEQIKDEEKTSKQKMLENLAKKAGVKQKQDEEER